MTEAFVQNFKRPFLPNMSVEVRIVAKYPMSADGEDFCRYVKTIFDADAIAFTFEVFTKRN